MAGKTYSGSYTTTVLLTSSVQQNPATLTGSIAVHGTNASSDSGFYSTTDFVWSITNLGHITATGVTSYGIALLYGGIIQNGAVGNSLGIIQSDETGILLTGNISSVVNDGTIIGTAGRGVFLQDGGTLTNGGSGATHATIEGGFVGVSIYNANGLLNNSGTILGTGYAGLAVELYAGTVNNQAGGQIAGVYGVGFVAKSAAGTLTNAGTIIGNARDGVELSGGGSVTNTGSISGAIAGVLALYGSTTINNSGSIGGSYAGIDLLAGGNVSNQAGARITGGFGVSAGNANVSTASVGNVVNSGIISGSTYQGVSLNEGGSVVNSGSIYGNAAGVAAFYGSAAVTNTGSIGSAFIGVKLGTGGTISNAAGATVAGLYGIVLGNGVTTGAAKTASSLTNAGQITASGSFGAELLTNGMFVNQAGGTISGGRYGAYIRSVTGTIANYGVIMGQVGVYSRAVVANGTRYPGQVTIINAGTIIGTGGVSVSMFSSDDLLIDRPGAVFTGGVSSGGGRLELSAGGPGTLGTLGAAIIGFSTITEDAGANWTMAGTLAATATLVDLGVLLCESGAIFTNKGVVEGPGTIGLLHNGVLASFGTLLANETVAFQDPSGHLSLTNALSDFALTRGFSAGDTIYLPDIALTGLTETFTANAGGGTLSLDQGGSIVGSVTLAGSYTTASFVLKADPNGGSDVMIPCFLAGTRIAVADGERRVERLRAGDRVRTASGAVREIVWVGHRTVDVAGSVWPDQVAPVRIAAHAFGRGLPHRDLLLSPDHAVSHAGVLIPVYLLINGHSVRRAQVALARYTHVELASHDILLAEGLAVESYLDTGNRALLGLGDAEASGMPKRAAVPCAPLVLGGPVLARARRHLLVQRRAAARAGREAAAVVTAQVEGALLTSVRADDGRLLFRLPPLAQRVTLIASDGCRLFGAILDGQLLDPCGPSYGGGFAAPVGASRAIKGRASLLLPRARPSPRSLELIVAG
jgi:hypothetical protein